MAGMLTAATCRAAPVIARRPWIGGAAIAARDRRPGRDLAAVVASPGAGPLTDQDRLVVADFVNTTGEPVFDGSLKVALAVALEQSPFLKVFPDARVRETLRLMQLDAERPRHAGRSRARSRSASS